MRVNMSKDMELSFENLKSPELLDLLTRTSYWDYRYKTVYNEVLRRLDIADNYTLIMEKK